VARLEEDQREHLVYLTVTVLLEIRRAYLAVGGSPLRHWDQITDRLRAAARTTASVPEWTTAMHRSLQLGAPSSSASSAIEALTIAVVEVGAPAWLDLLEREHGYVIARTRLAVEQRRNMSGAV
jgi:hypothetical protein